MGYKYGNLILGIGKATRPEGENADWCTRCSKSSLLIRPVWVMSALGLDAWGTVTTCRECKTSVWKNLKGVICRVVATVDAQKKLEQKSE